MATWTHGHCIATCKMCNRPVLYSETMIPKSNYGQSPYDPMTSVKNHYKKFHPMFWEQFFIDMKIPHPMISQLVNIKPKKHRIFPYNGVHQECWCGDNHRKVRTFKTHSYRKEARVTILEDIER